MIILIFLAEGTSSDECTLLKLQGKKNDDIDHDLDYCVLLCPSQIWLPEGMFIQFQIGLFHFIISAGNMHV